MFIIYAHKVVLYLNKISLMGYNANKLGLLSKNSLAFTVTSSVQSSFLRVSLVGLRRGVYGNILKFLFSLQKKDEKMYY